MACQEATWEGFAIVILVGTIALVAIIHYSKELKCWDAPDDWRVYLAFWFLSVALVPLSVALAVVLASHAYHDRRELRDRKEATRRWLKD